MGASSSSARDPSLVGMGGDMIQESPVRDDRGRKFPLEYHASGILVAINHAVLPGLSASGTERKNERIGNEELARTK